MLYSVLYTFVVDTEAVDDRSVLRNPETSRLWIAVLRLRSKRPYLNKAETEVCQIIIVFTILVQTACKSYWIREIDSEYLFCEGWCLFLEYASCD